MHVAKRLLERGERVVGIDEVNSYYDPRLKWARLAELKRFARFSFERFDVAESELLRASFERHTPDRVVHLAAQAGVRYSLENPFAYERANIRGHLSVLEACRVDKRVAHLVYASSSSVYGDRGLEGGAFRESDAADKPVSLYAATKRSCELMSETYSHLFGLPQSGLRFFTVYGPWGRPDMACFAFAELMLKGEPIEVYGQGQMARDFTYIDDIVDGIVGVLDRPPAEGGNRILNIGGSRPVPLMRMINALEAAFGIEAHKIYRPMQPGDVSATFADVSKLTELTGYAPKVVVEDGVARFAHWRRGFDWSAAPPRDQVGSLGAARVEVRT